MRLRTIRTGGALALLLAMTMVQAAESGAPDWSQRVAGLQMPMGSMMEPAAAGRHWQAMQGYLRDMDQSGACGMMGCGEWGPGMMAGSGWSMPSGMSPAAYAQAMQPQVSRMQSDMNRLAAMPDGPERQAALRRHWQDSYRQMQTLRGNGWMWQHTAAPAGNHGARLVQRYCSQCHAAPAPDRLPAGRWPGVVAHMESYMRAAHGRVAVPSAADVAVIDHYLQGARQ